MTLVTGGKGGKKMLNAIARITGFLVVAAGVQFIVAGLVHLAGTSE